MCKIAVKGKDNMENTGDKHRNFQQKYSYQAKPD